MWIRSDQHSWKNDEAAGLEELHCVVSELWWAGKTRRDWDNIYSSPQAQSMSWSLNVSGKRMADKERWEGRSMCVSTGPSSFLLHPFTFPHSVAKKSVCVCVFVTRYSHKRFCILSTLFIPPFHLNGSIFRWSFTVLPGFVLLWDEMRRLTGYGSVQNCKHTQVYVFPQKWDSLFCLHSVQLVPLSCSIKACKCFWKCVIIKVELIGDILFSSNYSQLIWYTTLGIYVCFIFPLLPCNGKLLFQALSFTVADLESPWRDRYCSFRCQPLLQKMVTIVRTCM